MAAAHAERQRDEASTDELRALYDTICVDEAKHAALAFKTLRWLLDANAALASVLDEERTRLATDGSFEERTLVGPMLDYLA
jgi:transposase-like protein